MKGSATTRTGKQEPSWVAFGENLLMLYLWIDQNDTNAKPQTIPQSISVIDFWHGVPWGIQARGYAFAAQQWGRVQRAFVWQVAGEASPLQTEKAVSDIFGLV